VTAWLPHNGDCEPAEKKPTDSVTYDLKRGTVAAVYLKVMPGRLDTDTVGRILRCGPGPGLKTRPTYGPATMST